MHIKNRIGKIKRIGLIYSLTNLGGFDIIITKKFLRLKPKRLSNYCIGVKQRIQSVAFIINKTIRGDKDVNRKS